MDIESKKLFEDVKTSLLSNFSNEEIIKHLEEKLNFTYQGALNFVEKAEKELCEEDKNNIKFFKKRREKGFKYNATDYEVSIKDFSSGLLKRFLTSIFFTAIYMVVIDKIIGNLANKLGGLEPYIVMSFIFFVIICIIGTLSYNQSVKLKSEHPILVAVSISLLSMFAYPFFFALSYWLDEFIKYIGMTMFLFQLIYIIFSIFAAMFYYFEASYLEIETAWFYSFLSFFFWFIIFPIYFTFRPYFIERYRNSLNQKIIVERK